MHMAANEYIQAAAAQLQNAANEVKVEADQLRSDLARMESNTRSEIDVKDQDLRLKNVELTATDNPNQASALNMLVNRMKHDMDDQKKQLEKARANIQQQIKGKEGAMQALKSQAQNLQNMAANFR
jgi:predicted RNase H-like nuclease (RuvC/YqgF family)